MQFKDFIFSKKVLVSCIAIGGIVFGVLAGLAYQSAHGQQGSLADSNQNNTGIMPQNSASGNNGAAVTDPGAPVVLSPKTKKKTKAVNTTDPACMVKAETNKKGLKVFYLPNMRGYAKVKAAECFKTAEAAAAGGYQIANSKQN